MEAGDMKAMREALEAFVDAIEWLSDGDKSGLFRKRFAVLLSDARAALALPRRNCDVGDSDEQAERFENFCLKHIGCAEETGGRHCLGCPLEKASKNITQKCELYWAQMPYEKGETDGSK